MSQALASARKRRGVPSNTPEVSAPTNTTQSNGNPNGLTLPQVISLVDRRLTTLETFMKETKENKEPRNVTPVSTSEPLEQGNWIDEFNHRFEMLAEEVANMKDIVLKLQSYTMEVNKTLLEERINVFSDLGNVNNTNEALTFDANDLTSVSLKNLVQQEFDTLSDI